MNKLGDALKHEREKRKISLEHIAAKTNINIHALTALENARFAEIPGGIYLRNYLKSYLNAIDVDPDVFLETYREEIAAPGEKKNENSNTYCTKLKYSRFKKRNMLLIILITVVVPALLFYLAYTKREEIITGWKDLNKQPDVIAIPQSGIDLNAGLFQDPSDRDHAPLNVLIEFSDRCWVLVNRGIEKIIEKTFQKGEKLETAGYNLTLYLDNPAGVRFLLNGKEVTYLQKLAKPEKLIITPATMEKLFEGGGSAPSNK